MSNKNTGLGFIINDVSKNKVAKTVKTPKMQDTLVRFDSGKTITFKDGSHHLLAIGTTGSGKTASVIVPAVYNMIKQGFPGFIVDIKGNLTAQIRAIAKLCGRESDIIEIGSELSASPINILQGLTNSQVHEFFTAMISHFNNDNDYNRHFHMAGVHMAVECFELLQIMAVKDQSFTPCIKAIKDLLISSKLSTEFFNAFVKNKQLFVSDEFSLEYVDNLIERIKGNAHHIFANPEVNKESNGLSGKSTYFDQLNYASKTIRMALDELITTPGIVRNFCNAQNTQKAFNMSDIFTKNKIVILRFSSVSGPTGERLSRYMAEQYYKAVYAYGMSLPKGEYSFVCYDEFQAFADLTNSRYSDASFIAQAREFNNIFIAATQSMSALTQYISFVSVDKFVSNCNCRIVLYSDDPLTQSMVNRYDEDIKLNELGHNAFVINYDAGSRRHMYSMESLQGSYESMKNIIKGVKIKNRINMEVEKSNSCVSSLTKAIQDLAKASKNQKAPKPKALAKGKKTYDFLPFTMHVGSSVIGPIPSINPIN